MYFLDFNLSMYRSKQDAVSESSDQGTLLPLPVFPLKRNPILRTHYFCFAMKTDKL